MVKPNLYEQWSTEEVPYKDTDLAKKTFSYRFPVHVAARLAAIEDMFPGKNRTEVIIGILKLGLAQFEESLPPTPPTRKPTEAEAQEIADEAGVNVSDVMEGLKLGGYGPRVNYLQKANAYFVQFEKERGIENPPKEVFKL